MQFDPAIHTKEFLLNNLKVVLNLAFNSVEFSASALASDLDLLRLDASDGFTVAHILATSQPEWLQSDASKLPEVLRLVSNEGYTVAHQLSKCQSEWLRSDASKSYDILRLANKSGSTVAHSLARHQPEWLLSDASKATEILRLANDIGDTVAHSLAEFQPEWLNSDASRSDDILRIANNNGFTVAHYLAEFQPEWIHSDTSKSYEILKVTSYTGSTVAHWLAKYQPKWLFSGAANSDEILRLAANNGSTVAHRLAECQPEWLKSEASKSPEILRLAYADGYTVALDMLNHEQCLKHDPLFHKEILALEHNDVILAEKITEKYSLSHGMDVPTIAMKLISQGAAYKHSFPMTVDVGHELIKQTQSLIDECIQPLVALKQLLALFSTCARAKVRADNVPATIVSGETANLGEWRDILLKSENMIRQHLNAHPELYDIEHTVDIFCEPADDLLKMLQSERILSVELGGLPSSISSNDIEPIKQAIY